MSWTVVIVLIMVGIYCFVTSEKVLSKYVCVIGRNAETAELSGISVNNLAFAVVGLMGMLAARGGWVGHRTDKDHPWQSSVQTVTWSYGSRRASASHAQPGSLSRRGRPRLMTRSNNGIPSCDGMGISPYAAMISHGAI